MNAFNLGWQYPETFGIVGAFSPSFWLAGERNDAATIQRTRMAQHMVDAGTKREGSRLWLSVGDREETDDRDGDGIIDAVDDARDLINGYAGNDAALRGLRQLGYQTNLGERDVPAASDTVAFRLFSGGEHNQASWAKQLPEFLNWTFAATDSGKLLHFPQFSSSRVAARNVDVWLPPGYDDDPRKHYPVLYLHDGQNQFDAARDKSYGGTAWGIDTEMARLIASGRIRPAIVVAIWNTPARLAEYMPAKAVTTDQVHFLDGWPEMPRGELRSDEYLAFLVDELKPFIDARFRALPGRDDTLLMGSSMGGLISAYAMTEYPQVFGRAACVSTHWPAGRGAAIDYFGKHLPDPATHRLYFDHGTRTLDAAYAPHQQRMDAAMQQAGYRQGVNWVSRVFPDAEHSEKSWRARVEIPLQFLLGR
ncbi:MAG: alpha/beta hydrolase-fold protein [Pseudoxanthomonas sp.]